MVELEPHVARVERAQVIDEIGCSGLTRSERGPRNRLETLLGDTMEFRSKLGRSRRTVTQGIRFSEKMSVGAYRVGERRSPCNLPKQIGIGPCLRLVRGTGNSCEAFGKTEELAPRLVYRRWVATKGLVRFRDVPIVEDACDRFARHVPNLTPDNRAKNIFPTGQAALLRTSTS